TWSPIARSSTPSPSSTTSAAASWPTTIGIGHGRSPLIADRSEWHKPAARTFTVISPRPGDCSATCSIDNGRLCAYGAGRPISRSTAARMVLVIASSVRCLCASQTREAQVLHFQVFVDPVLRALSAEAGLLDAAERRLGGRDQPGIDPDHARLDALCGTEDAPDVARVEIRGQPELGVVGHRDRLVVGPEAKQRRHRPE